MTDRAMRRRLEGRFGPLELRITQIVWDAGFSTVGDVLEHLNRDGHRGHVYNTVMTTMARLADKGHLDRERRGRAYVHRGDGPERFPRDRFAEETRRSVEELGELGVEAIHDALHPRPLALLQQIATEDES